MKLWLGSPYTSQSGLPDGEVDRGFAWLA